MKIFIAGSCVTRDAFTPLNSNKFTSVNYFARYSLARLTFPAVKFIDYSDNDFVDKVPSAFQRKVLYQEWQNTLLLQLKDTIFDYLVIDCVDDRFGLIEVEPDVYVTNSDELHKSKIVNIREANQIKPDSEIYLNKWEEGFKSLIDVVGSEKIIINNVYFSNNTNTGGNFPYSSPERIEYCNGFLSRLYEVSSKYLKDSQFVNYPKDMFVGDSDHKWGIAPFHYTEDVYDYFLAYLETLRK